MDNIINALASIGNSLDFSQTFGGYPPSFAVIDNKYVVLVRGSGDPEEPSTVYLLSDILETFAKTQQMDNEQDIFDLWNELEPAKNVEWYSAREYVE